MKHMTKDEAAIQALLRRSRTVVMIGASPRPGRHSHLVARYLHDRGYEVIPVRPDREDVDGMSSYARYADVPGPVDIVVVYRNAAEAPAQIGELEVNPPEVVWLPPGVWSPSCDRETERLGVGLVVDCCIEEELRRSLRDAAHPQRPLAQRSRSDEPLRARGRHAHH
jgi:predicted CoA-binding protein